MLMAGIAVAIAGIIISLIACWCDVSCRKPMNGKK